MDFNKKSDGIDQPVNCVVTFELVSGVMIALSPRAFDRKCSRLRSILLVYVGHDKFTSRFYKCLPPARGSARVIIQSNPSSCISTDHAVNHNPDRYPIVDSDAIPVSDSGRDLNSVFGIASCFGSGHALDSYFEPEFNFVLNPVLDFGD
ncbi:hypothetical protein EVAR_76452_1 [Eumeta japonica]|uniref:Uncharacterized protein n=1 Tax=Eumeta variegata TaxID=151549 RepID=A0A4C1T893_EUMVA|nr:hypothetical protein EVAR_76452_1 [Eumeta japonica]